MIGGGQVAERKIGGLLDAGARVRVISPSLAEGLRALADQGRIEWQAREAQAADVTGADLVFAAADVSTNRKMAEAARAAGVLVNLADDGIEGDFLLPAVVRRGRLVLAVSASGASPILAARIARELAARYGTEYEARTEALWQTRKMVKALVADREERRTLLRTAAGEAAWQRWRDADWLHDPPGWIAVLRQLSQSPRMREDEGECDA